MSYPVTSELEHPRMTPAVQVLIAINIAVMFVAYTIWRLDDMAAVLAFRWSAIDEMRWYTALTYMFVHGGLWHLFMNMYSLFLFGPRLEHMWGTKRFVRFYLLAGLGGLLAHVLFVHNDALLLGASAAIFGVMGAFALQWPTDEILFFGIVPMKVRTFVLLLVAFNLAMGLAGAGGVAYFAHLGGFAVAWFYMRTPQGMSIEQLRQRVSQVPDSDDSPPRAIPQRMPRQRERVEEVDEIVAKSKAVASKRPAAAAPARKRDSGADRQAEMDRVLDKISALGMESLTSEERQVLEEMSRRLRDS